MTWGNLGWHFVFHVFCKEAAIYAFGAVLTGLVTYLVASLLAGCFWCGLLLLYLFIYMKKSA